LHSIGLSIGGSAGFNPPNSSFLSLPTTQRSLVHIFLLFGDDCRVLP
jgi:hypothetical protein